MARNDNKRSWSGDYIKSTGNLVDDPKQISGKNASTTAAVLRVATNSEFVDQDGEVHEHAEFREVKVFGATADRAMELLRKGSRISYEGPLNWRPYENRDGEERESQEVIARELTVHLFDKTVLDEGEAEEESRSSRSSRTSRKNSSSSSRSRRSRRDEEDDLDDFDDDDEAYDDDDFDEDLEPKKPSRSSRKSSRSRSRDEDDDVEDDDEDEKPSRSRSRAKKSRSKTSRSRRREAESDMDDDEEYMSDADLT